MATFGSPGSHHYYWWLIKISRSKLASLARAPYPRPKFHGVLRKCKNVYEKSWIHPWLFSDICLSHFSIDFEINKGQLVAVVGHVGSGKSSLIGSLLEESTKLNGRVVVNVRERFVYFFCSGFFFLSRKVLNIEINNWLLGYWPEIHAFSSGLKINLPKRKWLKEAYCLRRSQFVGGVPLACSEGIPYPVRRVSLSSTGPVTGLPPPPVNR